MTPERNSRKLAESLLAGKTKDWLKEKLFIFLSSRRDELQLRNQILTRASAEEILQELIPAQVHVFGKCTRKLAAVVAAPHVSFDTWSEHFCNRIARELGLGWVIARNFRDRDSVRIHTGIGRHLHVNRPTESNRPGGEESVTARAQRAFGDYLNAIAEASGREGLPVDLLIEIHSARRATEVEVASCGIENELASRLCDCYDDLRRRDRALPALKLEPLHSVRLAASAAKERGSLRPEVATRALHVELPPSLRKSADARRRGGDAVVSLIGHLLEQLEA